MSLSKLSRQDDRRRTGGFTLLELIIAMSTIFMAVAIVLYAYLVTLRLFSGEMEESEIAIEMHKPMEQMENDLKNSLYIITGESSRIRFWAGNPAASQDVTYRWSPSGVGATSEMIYRKVGVTMEWLAKDISRLTFTYDNPGNIKRITIKITGRKNRTLGTVESSVKPRNL